MASNPMQKQKRNSFIAGLLLATIILGAVIGFLIYLMNEKNKEIEEEEMAKTMVWILAEDIAAGNHIADTLVNDDNVEEINRTVRLTTAEVDIALVPANAILDPTTAIFKNTVAKINLTAGTVLTSDMIVESEDQVQTDTREQEYNTIVLPSHLEKDQYIDIRIRFASGEDFIVVSKKKVIDATERTVWINVSEDEILTMSNAMVEAWWIGGDLYATTYAEPGIQTAATVTYIPSANTRTLIASDPNVLETARTQLALRLQTGDLALFRPAIDATKAKVTEEEFEELIASGTAASVEIQQTEREDYLAELEAAAQEAAATTTE